ncbi:WD40 repeat-containing protein [Dictyostelium discoideum AX4]|uniref:Diphthine methyltransferase homolog n=1 Tax=Dictyostelium discoideum TaxID=44689 RepID=DPH7_DICDI|nr:WD40 repeat-containing protein [Dictyostelium discoideum AX4]Q55C80.1 RecName: Full=Diphthine methyltransferase homolog; AltName: Full=Diphthamide biosynthesis protein 7 homolog; AltName: Full=WD repeat-containing protein 85 homolog [Dictyostelium discoideum]EAL72439.1 WD40 repeat-containing protein [Dictyostelium discoideum AX4]|eukprot:XP_646601.1 WD40 repeat-containing protein [Dictyostelium discoideum AX4]
MTEIIKNTKYLDYTSDSVEFYPFNNNIFVCGTYEIEKGDTEYKERRKGKLYLFEIEEEQQQKENDNNNENNNNNKLFKEIQNINFNSGILDMKWNNNKDRILGVVMSKGELNIYQYDEVEKKLELKSSTEISLSNDILSLSLDWNKSGDKLICSFSDGNIGLFKVTKDYSKVTEEKRWKAHDYEAWICAFNYHDESIVFSGGDDCKFKIWDLNQLLNHNDDDIGIPPTPKFTKRCDMGVTSIHCHPTIENLIAVGSYDECLRIWDLKSLKQPIITTDSLGGGIWRIKWHPFQKNKLVTACMGGGFHILSTDPENINDFSTLQIEQSYNGPHKSIAYGVDWSFNKNNFDKQFIGCCSFYDKCLSIWIP